MFYHTTDKKGDLELEIIQKECLQGLRVFFEALINYFKYKQEIFGIYVIIN